jgi:hypothetical protein
MIPRFFLSSPSRSTPPTGRALPLLLAALVLAAVGGCDTVNHRSSATDRADDATEAHVDAESFEQADLQFEPVSLAEGETFSVELKDKQFERGVTRITHEGTADGTQRLTARFDPLQPSSVSIRCRNKPAGTQQTVKTLSGDDLALDGEPIAYAKKKPTSYHYIDTGETVIVSVDYDQKAPVEVGEPVSSMRFVSPAPSAKKAASCTHVDFVLRDVSERLSPDGIHFHGDVAAPSLKKKAFR